MIRYIKLVGGRVAFWLGWPIWWLLMHDSERTRVLLVAGDLVLLTRGTLSAGEWSLPGGGLHRGESVIAGACREIEEELGFIIAAGQMHELATEQTHNSGIAYQAHYTIAQLTTPLEPSTRLEVAEARWVTADKVRGLTVDDVTLRALELWTNC